MKKRGWFRDLFSQFLILGLLGAVLWFLRRAFRTHEVLRDLKWLYLCFVVALALFAVMVILFIRQIFYRYALERYDPGSPASLERLARLRRFYLPRRMRKLQLTWPRPLESIIHFFESQGCRRIPSRLFYQVLEKPRVRLFQRKKTPCDRVFVFYHPVMNVLIVDQKLKQAERLIAHKEQMAPSRRNILLFVTDMTNFQEITSAGAGVVNFLGALAKGSLYPMLLDLDGGRLFYPIDESLMTRRHRLYYHRKRGQLKRLIARELKETEREGRMNPEGLLPSSGFRAERPGDVNDK